MPARRTGVRGRTPRRATAAPCVRNGGRLGASRSLSRPSEEQGLDPSDRLAQRALRSSHRRRPRGSCGSTPRAAPEAGTSSQGSTAGTLGKPDNTLIVPTPRSSWEALRPEVFTFRCDNFSRCHSPTNCHVRAVGRPDRPQCFQARRRAPVSAPKPRASRSCVLQKPATGGVLDPRGSSSAPHPGA